MKIERKIFFSNAIYFILIVIIGSLAIQYLNIMSGKLRFLEIADDLNASFLEMRLSEKNYFLFNDNNAIDDIKFSINQANNTMNSVREDIVSAIGQPSYDDLQLKLHDYSTAVSAVGPAHLRDQATQERIREAGRNLRDTSDKITQLERSNTGGIINRAKLLLYFSFIIVLFLAAVVSRSMARKILRPIKKIERLAKSISAGNFKKINEPMPKDEFGPVIEAINSMSDELEQREEEIIQSKKLASLGVLVAGVAHELNNPVNNISMIAQTYEELYPKLSENQRRDFMEKVDLETERIKMIVNNLLDFGRPKEPSLREIDINSVVEKGLQLVQNTLHVHNISIRVEMDDLPPLYIDVNQIIQVLVNLFLNASQAMPDGGDLLVATRLNEASGMVEVVIKDTGTGIPAKYLPNIFDPFFSMKEEGGTGLGLSVSYGIVRNHGGNLLVESELGRGTTFTVQLPVKKEEKGAA